MPTCLRKNLLCGLLMSHTFGGDGTLHHIVEPHTHKLTHTHTHIILALACVKPNLFKSLFWRHEDAYTDDHFSHTHTDTHYMLACGHICKPACDIHTHADAHLRSNPGRFISRGLQHSGCLSHFIGHRGRTGMGLFKSNPARPTHTYTCTHTHAYTLFCLAA